MGHGAASTVTHVARKPFHASQISIMLRSLIHNFLAAWKYPRWRWSLLTALASDALGFALAFYPPAQWVLDAITALLLFAMLGFRWALLPALAIEVVPGLQLFPAWTLVVAALASAEKADPGRGKDTQDVRTLRGPAEKM